MNETFAGNSIHSICGLSYPVLHPNVPVEKKVRYERSIQLLFKVNFKHDIQIMNASNDKNLDIMSHF